jgi:tetratricopeptide (TPR) repeat protein
MGLIVLSILLVGCGGATRRPPTTSPEIPASSQTSQTPTTQRLYESGRYREVLGSVDASNPEAVWFAAHSHLRLGQRDDAARQFTALAAAGAEWQAVSSLALALLANDAAALGRAEATALQFPRDPFVQFELGRAYASRADSAGAARAFDQCADANPLFAYAYYYAALAYDRINRPDLMAVRMDTFLKLAPQAPERPEIESILRTIRRP